MLKTANNPGGLPIEVFDQLRASVVADRSQFWKDLSMAFYGYNRPAAKLSEGVREAFWRQGMMAGFPAAYFCIKAFSETDLTPDLGKIDVPTLILHGDDDQIVRHAEGLRGRTARHVHDAQGPGERGPPGVSEILKGSAARWRFAPVCGRRDAHAWRSGARGRSATGQCVDADARAWPRLADHGLAPRPVPDAPTRSAP
jgi:hypothetical protein